MSLHSRLLTFETDPPSWQGPPRRLVPGVAPTERTIADDGTVVIQLGPTLVYPTGAELILEITERDADGRDPTRSLAHALLHDLVGGFRVEVHYADGRRAVAAPPNEEPPLTMPILAIQEIGGWPNTQEARYWLSPLPPRGPMTIAIAWPLRGIARCTTEIDGALLTRAQRRRA